MMTSALLVTRAYNPCTALVLHFLAPNSPFIALLVALAVSFQSHFLIGKYTELTKDREILAGEVMHEVSNIPEANYSLSCKAAK
jgi:hypothetical protein